MIRQRLAQAVRLFHTVRHLKAEQIVWRLWYRIRPLRVREHQGARARASCAWNGPGFQPPATWDGQAFTFLNQSGEVRSASDWNNPQFEKLWLYNLHYLDNLTSLDAVRQVDLNHALVDRWIAENPVAQGNGWEPYPLSLRIVNWVKWLSKQETIEQSWLDSLATQLDALSRQVEYHILANHLFANGKALVFGGAFLKGEDADRWLELGLKILDREISEQFLEDGGHFERSPMYHAILTWDLCDLIQLAEQSGVLQLSARADNWRSVLAKAVGWLRAMVHPDGDISFFNDATLGIAPRLSDIESYASALGVNLADPVPATSATDGWQPIHLTDSGLVVVSEHTHRHKALLNVAPIKPDYQPGHAHADTLSFELSLFGQRVIVNSGISQYGAGAQRLYERSTTAHSTVEIDGDNSSEIWSGFRVARRATVRLPVIETPSEGDLIVSGECQGYQGQQTHQRQWHFRNSDIQITDAVVGVKSAAVARFYLHQEVAAEQSSEMEIRLRLSDERDLHLRFEGAATVALTPSHWCRGFGVAQENTCISVTLSGDTLTSTIRWSDD